MGWQWHQLYNMQIICTSLQTDSHASTSPLSFYRPDALPAVQPTVWKHWRQKHILLQVVKVILHKATSPLQPDGSVVFTRWCQCAIPWGHGGHIVATWWIRLNLCFLWPLAHLSPQPKQQIDRFSHFCTAHGRKSLYLTMGALFAKIAPFPWVYQDPI